MNKILIGEQFNLNEVPSFETYLILLNDHSISLYQLI